MIQEGIPIICVNIHTKEQTPYDSMREAENKLHLKPKTVWNNIHIRGKKVVDGKYKFIKA